MRASFSLWGPFFMYPTSYVEQAVTQTLMKGWLKKVVLFFFFTLCKFSKLACAHVNINSPLSLYLQCCKHRPFDQVEGLILRVLACLWAYSNFGSQVKPIGDPSWICRSVSSNSYSLLALHCRKSGGYSDMQVYTCVNNSFEMYP